MYGYIYITKNNVNGKQYIGKHKSSEFDSKYIGSGLMLQNAIKKYGKDNFSCHILCECFSKEDLNNKEKEYIKQYNAVESNMFYNIAYGGEGGVLRTGPLSEETKAKIGAANTGKIKTPEFRKQQSERMLGNTLYKFCNTETVRRGRERAVIKIKSQGLLAGMNNPRYGKPAWNRGKNLSEEQKHRISETRRKHNISAPNLGKILIHKGSNSIYISPEELTTYEKQGYEIGGLPRTALRYINNGEIEKRVPEETLLEYINNGWKLGRTKHIRKKR